MMICALKYLPVGHLVAVNMTVFLMIIDAQSLRAAGKYAFPIIGRGF